MKQRKQIFLWIMAGLIFAWYLEAAAQNVGIGTNTPNTRAILDLTSTDKVFLPPRLTTAQMNAISSPPLGSMVYNTDLQQFMGYVRTHFNFIGQSQNRWLPVSTGPRMLAWGIVDSFASETNGSNNYSVTWNSTDRWYELTVTGNPYFKDSMLLMINAVGSGSWDQAISTGEFISGSSRRATIKFTDVSRIVSGWGSTDSRRRSNFHFTLYDLRTQPF